VGRTAFQGIFPDPGACPGPDPGFAEMTAAYLVRSFQQTLDGVGDGRWHSGNLPLFVEGLHRVIEDNETIPSIDARSIRKIRSREEKR